MIIDPTIFRPVAATVAASSAMRLRTGIVHGDDGGSVKFAMAGQPDVVLTAAVLDSTCPRPGAVGVFLTDGADTFMVGQVGGVSAPTFWVRAGAAQSIPNGGVATGVTFASPLTAMADAADAAAADAWGMFCSGRLVVNGGVGGLYGWVGGAESSTRATSGTTSVLVAHGGEARVSLRGLIPEQQYTVAADVYPTGAAAEMLVEANGTPVPGSTVVTAGTLGAWQRVSVTFTARAGQQQVVFRLAGSTAGDEAWIDGVHATAGAAAPAFSAGRLDALTAPLDGMYEVTFGGIWSWVSNGWRDVRAHVDGTTVARSGGAAINTQLGFSGHATTRLSAGDVVELEARQDSTVSVNLNEPRLGLRWLGR